MSTAAITTQKTATWVDICAQSELVENSGVCAMLPVLEHKNASGQALKQSKQIALFYIPSMDSVYVVSNGDPIGKANVIYRGMVGSIKGEPMVSSPLYKQHFSLITGICFEQQDVALDVYPSRIHNGQIQVSLV